MGVKFAVDQRLRLIDFLLAHYGYVSRNHVMDYFGLGVAQASADIREYKKRAPANAIHDRVSGKHIRGAEFKRLYD